MKSILIIILVLFLSACGKTSQTGTVQHYHLTGKVISLNAKEQTAKVAAEAIPNFMEAMTMEYPVKSKTDFQMLSVGMAIEGTVNVAEAGGYDLSDIKIQSSGK